MFEFEYITKEMEWHPEPEYLADLRILRRFVRNGSFGYRESDDVVFQTLKNRYPEAHSWLSGPKSGMPVPIRMGIRVMISSLMRPAFRNPWMVLPPST